MPALKIAVLCSRVRVEEKMLFAALRQRSADFERVDPRGHRYYWFAGTVAERAHAPDTDCWAVENGVISLTPLYFDLTHREMLAADRPWRVDGYPEID